ncbi:hypothetical protein AWH62_04905 [Maricaulis sp. W15]|uniref:DUF6134 family protein n=1 Tax=Maricaulis sp. W15 TaxID=1772333 RepID=UPI000949097D|nr:DUF6134 family protein [Maricaulis sp. W15]OLF78005.1 hypothetical protein AWH62_04905 [Maricaulis sp. W15]
MTLPTRFRIAALCALLFAAVAPAAAKAEMPRDVVFDVYRNGSLFGEHAVRFAQLPGGELRVDIDVELRVGFGPVTVFHYQHESEEVWVDGALQSLQASTLKAGDREYFMLRRRPDGHVDIDGDIVEALHPSSHWSGYTPGVPAVLNTETGEPMAVEIEDLGVGTVATADGAIEARHLRMTGTVAVDLWYDAAGRWVGCAFTIGDQDIVYRLRDA